MWEIILLFVFMLLSTIFQLYCGSSAIRNFLCTFNMFKLLKEQNVKVNMTQLQYVDRGKLNKCTLRINILFDTVNSWKWYFGHFSRFPISRVKYVKLQLKLLHRNHDQKGVKYKWYWYTGICLTFEKMGVWLLFFDWPWFLYKEQ
jgi:hypothetical protein